MPPEQADIAELLTRLSGAGIEFIVVGGAAAVLHGAPITTRDLDIVHERSSDNVERLLQALGELDALIRDPAQRRIRPTQQMLQGPGQILLFTRLGPLDCLGTLHDGRGFAELEDHTVSMTDSDTDVRVLDLSTVIAVKSEAGRPKDRIVVPILLALLDEQSKDS